MRHCYDSKKIFYTMTNSLWHSDGYDSLIRWVFVIHGCIDGYSRRVVFLESSDNNWSQNVLKLFFNVINNDGGLRLSRIRVDYDVETVFVCECDGWKRSSARNQRIERVWSDFFEKGAEYFYERSYHDFSFTIRIWPEKPIYLRGGLGTSSIISDWY